MTRVTTDGTLASVTPDHPSRRVSVRESQGRELQDRRVPLYSPA